MLWFLYLVFLAPQTRNLNITLYKNVLRFSNFFAPSAVVDF